jgi:hypothetical protein
MPRRRPLRRPPPPPALRPKRPTCSSGADVAGVGPVPAQMWPGRAQSWRRCGRGGPSPGADVAGVSPVPVQMWQQRVECSSGADVGRGESPVPVQMWAGASAVPMQMWAGASPVPVQMWPVRARRCILWARHPWRAFENALLGRGERLEPVDERHVRRGRVGAARVQVGHGAANYPV